jgi:hypothetical protein
MAKIMWESPVLKYTRRGWSKGEGSEKFLNDKERLKKVFIEDTRKLSNFENVYDMMNSDIHPLLKVDPIAYAKFNDTESITMIEALFDKALPPETREQLWKALGKPKRYIVPMGHVTWFPFEYALGKFILKKLGIKSARKKLRLLESTKPEESVK